MKKKSLYLSLLIIFFVAIGSTSVSFGKKRSFIGEIDQPVEIIIQQFIDHMIKTYNFDRKKLEQWLVKTSPDKQVLSYIYQPYEKVVTWDVYKKHFITQDRIKDGVEFWNAHKKILKNAEKLYGVPAYIIVGILGVETNFGKVKMHFKALQSLVTLAFYYPPRAEFFKQELEEYLILTRERHIPPETLYSSYAGALGIPQFMPSCYRRYSVSASTAKKKADLISDFNDAVFSVANYLRVRGHWEPHTPVTVHALVKNQKNSDKLCSTTAKPIYTVSHYTQLGVKPLEDVKSDHKATLIKLMKENNTASYWLTFRNFSAIMSYNPRIYYAMTVYQLGKAIQDRMEKTGSQPK